MRANDDGLKVLTQEAIRMDSNQEARFFQLSTPLLSEGKLQSTLAEAGLMTVAIKVYATGGENAMHIHPNEDHIFVVLQGQATFHVQTDENSRTNRKYEGVMLPKGTPYWFQSTAAENLVMLRVGADAEKSSNWRTFPDGTPFTLETDEQKNKNKSGRKVVLSGEHFSG